ncbi:hypothetical protein AN958_02539 [Leucoagaricus sp. SymC.cos]|nr:hypothetical protein AN958_02539 [Leucoagaricus sp. SymC.cos]
MQAVADAEVEKLGAKVSFSRSNKINASKSLIRTLADQLARRIPKYHQYILGEVNADPLLWEQGMQELFRKLIEKPFGELYPGWDTSGRWLILIDGLDEYDCGERAQREIVEMIGAFTHQYPASPLDWIIASRPEWWLKAIFFQLEIKSICLHEQLKVDTHEARQDVEVYLRHELGRIQSVFAHHFSPSPDRQPIWPSEFQISALAKHASGSFTYAANACRFIEDSKVGNPINQLSALLRAPLLPFRDLYLPILQSIAPPAYVNSTRRILGCCKVLPRNTFHLTSFMLSCNLLGISQNDAYASLQQLYSVLDVPSPPEAITKAIRAYHSSLFDFLEDRSESQDYYVSRHEAGADIVKCSFRILDEVNKGDEPFPRPVKISLTWVHEPTKTCETLLAIAYDGFRLLPTLSEHRELGLRCVSLLAQADFSKLDCYLNPDIKQSSIPDTLKQLIPVKELTFRSIEIQSIRSDRSIIYFRFTSEENGEVARPKVYSDRQDIRDKFKGGNLQQFVEILQTRRRKSPSLKAQVWGSDPWKSCLLFEYEPSLKLQGEGTPVTKEIFFIPYIPKTFPLPCN